MAVALSPTLIPQYFIAGQPASGALLFSYMAGTTTKQAVYIDSSQGTQFTNPIILNADGYPQDSSGNPCGLWLDPTLAYKFVFSPSTDTDPPTDPIWTIDNVVAPT